MFALMLLDEGRECCIDCPMLPASPPKLAVRGLLVGSAAASFVPPLGQELSRLYYMETGAEAIWFWLACVAASNPRTWPRLVGTGEALVFPTSSGGSVRPCTHSSRSASFQDAPEQTGISTMV